MRKINSLSFFLSVFLIICSFSPVSANTSINPRFISKSGPILSAAQLPSGVPPYSDHIVTGVSPNGTTIDLFDYWIFGQYDNDNGNNTSTPFITKGINNGHALLFGKGMNSNGNNIGNWNKWTGSKNPYRNIVDKRLGDDGYPKLALTVPNDTALSTKDGNQSLAYLFNPAIDIDGKESFKDVKGLLQVDQDGYYYYNSKANYAVYYRDTNSFVLYDHPGVSSSGAGGISPGQFFPFNVAANDPNSGGTMNNINSQDAAINHYFGMHMTTRFIQQFDGYTSENKIEPVTYDFGGDNDVWIFIDGVLVADLGGIHDFATVNIDFSTGIIKINGTEQPERLGKLLEYQSDSLPNNTYHTLDFYYLERGNVDSNMELKYNLVNIPESSLIKVDQLGDAVAGAEFALYAADAYAANPNSAQPIAKGVTNNNGEFVFLDDEDYPITIQNLYDNYEDNNDSEGNNLILVETKTPDGYRAGDQIKLSFYQTSNQEVLLLSNSVWDEGAYAMPKVTTTTPNIIRKYNDPTTTVVLTGNDAIINPLMFAVIYKKSGDTWLPVSGDPINGWNVESGNDWSNVLSAAKNTPYIFQLGSSGAYQVEINNLPGDIKNYYYICQKEDQAKYTIAYYYSEAKTIAQASEDNTWRIDSDPSGQDKQYALSRVFSVDLYVSNLKNQLYVQKVDNDGNTVDGATFALYKAEDTITENGVIKPKNDAAAYDTLITSSNNIITNLYGGGVFPTAGEILETGEYYLFETSVPKGYRINTKATHIIIDNTGVYADAGEQNDGINVLLGVGSLMRSMVQFAADDDVDTTLHEIKAALTTNITFNNYNSNGSFSIGEPDWDNTQVKHFQFANNYAILDYGLYDQSPATIDNLTFAVDEGWSKIMIRQCYRHDNNVDVTLKQNLDDTNITNLFSESVLVRVTNDKTGDLKLKKIVEGQDAPSDHSFTFHLNLTDNSRPINGTYSTKDKNGVAGTITISNGKATVDLKNGEEITILDLPAGVSYQVTETSKDGYKPEVSVSGDNSYIVNEATVNGTIQHTLNDRDPVTLTYTNRFDGSTAVNLIVNKTLLGRNITSNDQFSFIINPSDETKQAIEQGLILMPNNTITLVGNNSSSTIEDTFNEIRFLQEGEFDFTISEQLPAGTTNNDPIKDGILYDLSVVNVKVTVIKNETTGILSAAVAYGEDYDQNKAYFTNSFNNLTIVKEVTGDLGDRNRAFSFVIDLTNHDQPLSGSYRYSLYQKDQQGNLNNIQSGYLVFDNTGKAAFTLSHNQTLALFGLPFNAQYHISETDITDEGYEVSINGNSGNWSISDEITSSLKTVTFINNKSSTPNTGIKIDNYPWIAGGLIIAGAIIVFGAMEIKRLYGLKGGHDD